MTVSDLLLDSEAVQVDLVNEFNQSVFVDSCNVVLSRHVDAVED